MSGQSLQRLQRVAAPIQLLWKKPVALGQNAKNSNYRLSAKLHFSPSEIRLAGKSYQLIRGGYANVLRVAHNLLLGGLCCVDGGRGGSVAVPRSCLLQSTIRTA